MKRIFKKNVFLVDQINILSSPKALKRRCFGQIFCAAGKFFKKQVKKFWKILTKIKKQVKKFKNN